MKKALKVIGLVGFMVVIVGVAMAEMTPGKTGTDPAQISGLCGLIRSLSGLFGILKILAFSGAAFILASMAWTWISADKGDAKILEDAKKRGVSMIVGFVLLMIVGLIVQFLPGFAGCKETFENFGAVQVNN